jgi:hypothetical protein
LADKAILKYFGSCMLLWQEMFVPYFEAAKRMGWQFRLLLSDIHQSHKERKR